MKKIFVIFIEGTTVFRGKWTEKNRKKINPRKISFYKQTKKLILRVYLK